MLAHKEINRLCRWQKELYKALEIEKRPVEPPVLNEEMMGEIERNYTDRLRASLDTEEHGKGASYAAVDALEEGGRRVLPRRPARAAADGEENLRPHQGEDFPRRHPQQPPPARRSPLLRDSPHRLRSRLAPARPRLGAVHARRDAGHRHHDARHERGRAVHGRPRVGRDQAPLPAALQLPALLGRRGRALRLDQPPRDRPRRSGAPRARTRAARRGRLPLLAPHRLGHHGVERLLLDGFGVRRQPLDDGRGRADQGVGRGRGDGPRHGGQQVRHPLRHRGRRRPLRRHGLQGRRHARRHHRLADGHQDRRHQRADHGRGVAAGEEGAPAHPRRHGGGARASRAPTSARTRRASSPSRSTPTASAT